MAPSTRSKPVTSRVIASLLFCMLLFSVVLMFHLHVDIGESLKECTKYESLKKMYIKNFRQGQFSDLQNFINIKRDKRHSAPFEEVIIKELPHENNPTLGEVLKIKITNKTTSQLKFQLSIRKHELYRDSDNAVEPLLHDLATAPIIAAANKEGGTQIKLKIKFDNDTMALFKPMRFPRETQTRENHFYFSDYERHNAEIAGYHLDRALGFRRTMPVVGRIINMTQDIEELVERKIKKTFYTSPAGNKCFYGVCVHYCHILYAVCGKGEMLEGSFAAYTPRIKGSNMNYKMHPWKRSYSAYEKAAWETDDNYCKEVRSQPLYSKGRRLLDIMDMAVFDFIMGNADRHSYDFIEAFGDHSAPVLLDNGRGFGRPFFDDFSILAPLTQCCLIRESTLQTLLNFFNGPEQLSDVMRQSLSKDPLTPILWEPHYAAMDRRVQLILLEIQKCIANRTDHHEKFIKITKHLVTTYNKRV